MVTLELADKMQHLVSGNLPAWQQEIPHALGTKNPATASNQQMQIKPPLLAQSIKQQGAGISGEGVKLPSMHFKGTINLLHCYENDEEQKRV